jgi:hypothetical protein
VVSQVPSYNHFCPVSSHVLLILSESHLHAMLEMSSPMTSCIHHVLSSKRISSSIAPMIDPVWNLRKPFFHSEQPLELLDQEDQLMKCNTSRVIEHNPIQQYAMPPMHQRESGTVDREVFFLSTVPLSFLLSDQLILHHFLCPLLRKSQDEISFRGEDCNTPCYKNANYFH